VLCEWITYLASTSHPTSKWMIVLKVNALCYKRPSRFWVQSFLSRHPQLKLGRPSGLDPKHAQAFNPATVKHHFELL
jgi:hypothetical protein